MKMIKIEGYIEIRHEVSGLISLKKESSTFILDEDTYLKLMNRGCDGKITLSLEGITLQKL